MTAPSPARPGRRRHRRASGPKEPRTSTAAPSPAGHAARARRGRCHRAVAGTDPAASTSRAPCRSTTVNACLRAGSTPGPTPRCSAVRVTPDQDGQGTVRHAADAD
jgi:hypothetical protein